MKKGDKIYLRIRGKTFTLKVINVQDNNLGKKKPAK